MKEFIPLKSGETTYIAREVPQIYAWASNEREIREQTPNSYKINLTL